MSSSDLNIVLKEKQLFLDFQGGKQAFFDYFFDKYYQSLCVYEYPLIDTELKLQIEKAIQNLPDGIRKTFILNRFEGLKYQQIADQENISVKTVEYRISKAFLPIVM